MVKQWHFINCHHSIHHYLTFKIVLYLIYFKGNTSSFGSTIQVLRSDNGEYFTLYFITVVVVALISIFILLLKNVLFYLLQILLSEIKFNYLLYLLQSAETIEVLSQTPFVEKIKMMTTTKLSFICLHIVLQIYNVIKLLHDKETTIGCSICLILRKNSRVLYRSSDQKIEVGSKSRLTFNHVIDRKYWNKSLKYWQFFADVINRWPLMYRIQKPILCNI